MLANLIFFWYKTGCVFLPQLYALFVCLVTFLPTCYLLRMAMDDTPVFLISEHFKASCFPERFPCMSNKYSDSEIKHLIFFIPLFFQMRKLTLLCKKSLLHLLISCF